MQAQDPQLRLRGCSAHAALAPGVLDALHLEICVFSPLRARIQDGVSRVLVNVHLHKDLPVRYDKVSFDGQARSPCT